MRTILNLCLAGVAAAKAAAPAADGNALVDYITGLIDPVKAATIGAVGDAIDLATGAPSFAVSVYVWAVDILRSLPGLVKNVYNGDDATIKDLTDFTVYAAGTIFAVYASLTALNLVLSLAAAVKDYVSEYMVIPTKLPVVGKLPEPVMTIRNTLQKEVLDRIIAFQVKAWIVPLEGQSGVPSLKGATSVLASTASACMILASTPAILSLMGGANKADAEAVAWTVGTALGIQYLVKTAA